MLLFAVTSIGQQNEGGELHLAAAPASLNKGGETGIKRPGTIFLWAISLKTAA